MGVFVSGSVQVQIQALKARRKAYCTVALIIRGTFTIWRYLSAITNSPPEVASTKLYIDLIAQPKEECSYERKIEMRNNLIEAWQICTGIVKTKAGMMFPLTVVSRPRDHYQNKRGWPLRFVMRRNTLRC